MSRRIDPDRPYTDEEKAYLLTRANGASLIAVNERRFAHLSKTEQAELTKQAQEDAEKELMIEQQIQKELEEEESDSYHPDDIAVVEPLTIAQLRAKLEEEGLRTTVTKKDTEAEDDPMTEKEVLAYRLLNRLDEKRNAARPE